MAQTRRIDAGLYQTLDGRATIESQARVLDGEPSDYGSDGWWLTMDGDRTGAEVYDTKRDALSAYTTGLAEGLWPTTEQAGDATPGSD